MQAIFTGILHDVDMAKAASRLKALREAAGLSQRELARQIGQDQSNVHYWENTGKIPRSDVLAPMAKALGVTVEDLLGEARPKRVAKPGGKLGQVFESVSRLPRRQQEKIVEIFETVLAGQQSKANGH
jgi:transcriptional regulator with XRE-family HTH domain